jgi:hypothetical protein
MKRWIPVVLVFVGLMVVAPTADARQGDPRADTRACADSREVNSTWSGIGRTDLETRWEVKGLGQHYDAPAVGDLVIYPWCDHGGGDTSQAFIGLRYAGATGRIYTGFIYEWDCTWGDNGC